MNNNIHSLKVRPNLVQQLKGTFSCHKYKERMKEKDKTTQKGIIKMYQWHCVKTCPTFIIRKRKMSSKIVLKL